MRWLIQHSVRAGVVAALTALMLTAPPVADAAPVGTAFTYQGRLKSAGAPLNATADFQVSLWDAAGTGSPPTGGTQIGATQAVNTVTVTGGLFTVQLNAGGEFGASAFNGDARWLQIAVRSPAGGGTFATLSPRQALTAAPYALFALNAGLLDGISAEAFLLGQVPIAISGPSGVGAVEVTNTSAAGGSMGIIGSSQSATGAGVLGYVGGSYIFTPPAGVVGTNNLTSGSGVVGRMTSTSGTSQGGLFTNASSLGIGVKGIASSSTGFTYGGHFTADSSSGRAVYGIATNPTGSATFGGYFGSQGQFGTGVLGEATGTTGHTFGGQFSNYSTSGYGVHARAFSTTGTSYGGVFQSDSPTGAGGGFRNRGLGNVFDVDLSGPSGAISTAGFLHREYTASTPSAAIPIAYGSISATGTINGGTGNFTVSQPATGQYDITITGETYSNNTFTVTITPVTNSPRITGVADAGVGFRVNMWNLAGTLVDNAFHFTVWTADPSNPG